MEKNKIFSILCIPPLSLISIFKNITMSVLSYNFINKKYGNTYGNKKI